MIIYRGYQIKPHKEVPTCYIIVTDGKGGKIPEALTGMFTHTSLAKEHIDVYLAQKPKKEADAETISKT